MQNFFQRIFSPRYLLATNAVLGTSFMVAGDVLAQKLDIHGVFDSKPREPSHKEELDLNQCKAMAAAGLYFGVTCHYWYLFLDRKFHNTKRSVTKKLICDSSVGIPFAGGLFLVTGLVKRQSPSKIVQDFKNSFWYLVAADFLFFMPLQSINFYFLPTRYRFLYVGCITIVYDTFLSHIINTLNKDTKKDSA